MDAEQGGPLPQKPWSTLLNGYIGMPMGIGRGESHDMVHLQYECISFTCTCVATGPWVLNGCSIPVHREQNAVLQFPTRTNNQPQPQPQSSTGTVRCVGTSLVTDGVISSSHCPVLYLRLIPTVLYSSVVCLLLTENSSFFFHLFYFI